VNVAAGVAVLGDIPKHINKDDFLTRACFVDARGGLEIGENVTFGFGVKILTRSHEIGDGAVGDVNARPVTIADNAWIGSYAILYNCTIGAGSIVSIGSVVRSCNIAPGVIVAGNPAEVIARWDGSEWIYEGEKYREVD